MKAEVETYSGFKAAERPLRFRLGANSYEVREVLDRWYGPDATWFKVLADDGRQYVLCYRPADDAWTLESLVSPSPGSSR